MIVTVRCPKCDNTNLYAGVVSNYSGVLICEHCNAEILVKLSGQNLIERPKLKEGINVGKFKEFKSAPQEINNDFLEAQKCFNIGAHKATIVMCRRTLEQVAKNQKATGKTLFDKINSMYKSGMISKPLFDLATEIRYFGNYGAHPTDDLLGEVTNVESETVMEITEHLIDHTYEVPEKIKQLKAKRKKKS